MPAEPVPAARRLPTPSRLTVRDWVVRGTLLGLLALGVAAVVWTFSWLVFYLVLGGVLAYLMRPVVDWLRGLGLGPASSIAVTFVAILGGLALLIVAVAPFVIQQVSDLSQQLSVEAITSSVEAAEVWLADNVPLYERGTLGGSLRELSETLFQEDGITSTLGSVVTLFTSFVYALLIIPFITFFFLRDGAQLRQDALQWVPNRYFEVTLNILDQLGRTLGRYLRALLLQCFLVAVVASSLLYLSGLSYALAVGLFAGLANSIPYFGPLVGFVAGTVVGIVQTGDLSMVPAVFVAMGFTQLVDNLFFHPLIFSRAAQAHPLVILVVVLVGAQLGGLVGMLVAIPVATTLRVVVQQVTWSIRNYRIVRASR